MVKKDSADTLGAWPSNQDGKRFLTINLYDGSKARSQSLGFIDLGVPTV